MSPSRKRKVVATAQLVGISDSHGIFGPLYCFRFGYACTAAAQRHYLTRPSIRAGTENQSWSLPRTTWWADQIVRARRSLTKSDSDSKPAAVPVRALSKLSLFSSTRTLYPQCTSTARHSQATRLKLNSDRELCCALVLYRGAENTLAERRTNTGLWLGGIEESC